MDEALIQRYEPEIQRLSRFYYWLNKGKGDFDLEDFEQVGRMAVWNVSKKRPEKISNMNYVKAVIKYSIFNEMRKMKHREKHIYLAREDGPVPLTDVLPTKEKGNKFDESEDLLYHIKHEFSKEDAEGLERLLENCENIYDLNLTQPPSTDTKDRVGVVTRMDLNDEEMLVYARVLLGDMGKFPNGYAMGEDGRKRAQKYMKAVLEASSKTPREFLREHNKLEMLRKFRLSRFYASIYNYQMFSFLKDIDDNVTLEEMVPAANPPLPETKIAEIINAYEKYEGVAGRAAEALGLDRGSIVKYWKQQDFSIREPSDTSLTPRQVHEILASYQKYKGNAAEAGRNIGHSTAAIIKYWRKAGLEIKEAGKGRAVTSDEEREILEAHSLYNGNASEVARHLNYHYRTVLKYWKKHKLPIFRLALFQEEEQKVRDAYNLFKGNAAEAARNLGYHSETILRKWREAGFQIKNTGRRLKEDDIKKILDAHSFYNGILTRAAANLPYSTYTIWRYWKEAKLEMGKMNPPLTEDEVSEIVSSFDKFQGKPHRAAKALGYDAGTIKKYWSQAGLTKKGKRRYWLIGS